MSFRYYSSRVSTLCNLLRRQYSVDAHKGYQRTNDVIEVLHELLPHADVDPEPGPGDGNDSVARRLARSAELRTGVTHKAPSSNISPTAAFCLVGICNRQSIGSGRMRIATSETASVT